MINSSPLAQAHRILERMTTPTTVQRKFDPVTLVKTREHFYRVSDERRQPLSNFSAAQRLQANQPVLVQGIRRDNRGRNSVQNPWGPASQLKSMQDLLSFWDADGRQFTEGGTIL